ncbi:MAG: ABC transporter ATP-binding protein [Lachnospiraceae bacterium]|nr:ABC transporter ATP-binding protein [Lachnospiraceae bacterium]
MIDVRNVSKYFNDIAAVDKVSFQIREGAVFGLIGMNGAGKSSLLRLMSGIYRADEGVILVDDQQIFDNVSVKKKIFYISDEQYFFENATLTDISNFYKTIYEDFDLGRFDRMIQDVELNPQQKIHTYSKGMRKQLSMICGICSGTKYLFCDETFDGLDPVMRQMVKNLMSYELTHREFVPVIASHNMRELEDICDHVGLLYKGGMLLSKDVQDMKLHIHKAQCVFREEGDADKAFEGLDLISRENRGSLYTVTVRGHKEHLESAITAQNPLFYEILPLSLEEIFISETEVAGYDIKKIIG